MYVTDLEISDLRSFHGTQSISLDRGDGTYAGWTVFAGRNGAGKSTLLKAIALSIIGPLAARSLAGVFTDWVRHGAEHARVGTPLTFDETRDHAPWSGVSAVWTGLQWDREARGPDRINPWYKEGGGRGDMHDTAWSGPWESTPKGWFVAGYGPYRRLGPATQDVMRLSAHPVLSRLVNLFFEAATLSEAVEWLKHVHARALEDRVGARELRDDVLGFLAAGLLPDDSIVERVDSEGLWVNRDDLSVPLEQVSDGYRTVTALVVDLIRCLHDAYGSLELERDAEGTPRCMLPGVVLIDEIDAHMHIAWQQRIGFWLTKHFPRIQFLVTTHSPFICQAASPRGIIRLPAPGERDRSIAHVEGRLFSAIVNGGADDAVLTELFGLEHAHSIEAERLRREVADLEELVLTGGASDEQLRQYEELAARLPNDLGEFARRRSYVLESRKG
jgi:energy-coupling factor transporter ATP-binding protein EcfA2